MVHALRGCSGHYCGPQSCKQRPPGVLACELNNVLYGARQQAQTPLQLLLPTAIIFVLKSPQSRHLGKNSKIHGG
jgi:hypothetical protein